MKRIERGEILGLADYEEVRERFRARVIGEKKRRRVEVGPIASAVFENRDTVLLQIQEMLRTERITRDEAVQHEVDTYNELIPDAGELSGTLFLELTSDDALREWLPRLVGIEHHISIALPDGSAVPGRPSDEDEDRLTRDDVTAAVHYLRFTFTPEQVAAFERGPVRVVVDHPEYRHEAELDVEQHTALVPDLVDLT